MEILLGLLIIAIGAFCQSSCYVPINKIKDWSWESYWIVQGVFAWLVFPLLGALLAVPADHSLCELFAGADSFRLLMTIVFGVLWGVGGLTFGLSMRYLGVALGQSIALGTCAALGTIMGPVLLNAFFPELDALSSLTVAVVIGVVATLAGIAVIGVAGAMKSASLSEEEKKAAVKDFNFPKGIARTARTKHGAITPKKACGATTLCSAPSPACCGIRSSSACRSEKVSSLHRKPS